MSLVVAMDEIKPEQIKRTTNPTPGNPVRTNTTFFRATSDTPDAPSAYLSAHDPGQRSAAHFHVIDQFQLIVAGKGKFGRHDVSPYCLHFSRAYTPYGPLLADSKTGMTFLGLRGRYDDGGDQQFPAAVEKLKRMADRRPRQIMKRLSFPAPGLGVSVQDVSEIKDDQGLFVSALTMAPGASMTAPDPSLGGGQFVVVLKGSLVHDDKERKALTVAFINPQEAAFQIRAGAQGLEGLILNLPQVKPRAADAQTPASGAGFKKWQCALCAFAYDEALGLPEEGIPPRTRWKDVPDSWSCPDCSANKNDFQMVEV